MPSNADDLLMEFREKLRTKRKLEGSLQEARKSLAAEKARLNDLGAILAKEEADVRKLEGLGLTAMFHQLLGSKEDRLDKEKQEAVAARLKHGQCAYEVSSLEREIGRLEAAIAALGDAEAGYDRALEAKASLIGGAPRAGLVKLTNKLADLNADAKEIGEAVAAGNDVLAGLDAVISDFKSASNWGIVDLVGGGIIITAVKHSKIDRAKAGISEVQSRIGRFQRELADLKAGPDSPRRIEISSFEKFADFLFDGLIFDWIVQSKIQRSLAAAREMRAKVEGIVESLRRDLAGRRKTRKETERARQELIEAGS
jgi:hypothetical protein